tara:strand:+ start:252 stop:1148 length:897 start_codon:yes stop_codon:yes gene_type:complete
MEELLKKIKKLVESGTPPTRQRMRGDPPPKESPVAKKRRLEKRTQFTEKTDRGALKVNKKVDRGSGSYQDNVSVKTKTKTTTKNGKAKTFGAAFAAARAKLGPGKTFEFKGKKYTTDRADDKKNVSPIVKNEKTKVDKKVAVTPKVDKKVAVTPKVDKKVAVAPKNDKKVTTKKTATFVQPGKAEPIKITNRQRRTEELSRLAFRSANLMKQGEGRQRALKRARKIAFRDLAGGGTANSKNGKPIPEGSAGAGLRALKAVNPSITRNMGYAKMGGITKRRFGGMAKGGFKMPNKVSKS